MQGLYTYCVGAKNKHWSRMRQFSIPITGRSMALEVIPYRDIEAVVGRILRQEFERLQTLKNIEDEEWFKEKILTHEQVVREVMLKTPPVVPFKFGIIFKNRFGVKKMLKSHYRKFQGFLEQFTGKYEWGLKIFSRPEMLKHKVKQGDPDITHLVLKMKKQSTGKKYFLEKELEAKCKERTEEKERVAAENLQNLITPLCDQYELTKVLSRHIPGRDDELVVNVALLIADTALDGVQQHVHHWNKLHDQAGLSAELTGPWPPYNFATL